MKKIYTILMMALLCTTTFAKTPKADRLYEQWEYFRAAQLYEAEVAKNPSADLYFKLGECYRKMNKSKEQQAAYDKVNEAGVYSKPEFYLNYGQVLKNNGKYAQAKIAFDKYNQLMPSDPRGKFFSQSIDIIAEDHKWDESINIINVNVLNTTEGDFATVMYTNGMVFTSSRKTPGHGKIYGWTGDNYLDLYYAKKGTYDTSFSEITPFGGKNLEKKYHDGPACFSKNFDTIYTSRVAKDLKGLEKKTLNIETSKIFMSVLKDSNWTKTIPFQYNSDTFSVANPYLSKDGNRLYFVSDMPGGYGKTDIYYCNRQGENWSNPVNMGANVNTFNREKFPTMDSLGNFYFASDGYQGFGGLDICVSLTQNGYFSKAIPMKYPLNSSKDDYAITFLKGERTGYITSNRYEGGQGDDDILFFDLGANDFPLSIYTIGYRPKHTEVFFAVNSPKNIMVNRKVRETFPIRNYIFFDLGSSQIPDRYVLLTKDKVKTFKESQLEVFTPKNLTGRSSRQMTAYYNILNILGDRMGKNPSTTIKLVGSSEQSIDDAKAMAESVKSYLVTIFGINGSRITIEGNNKPKIPSQHIGGVLELTLLKEGDRRVSIESSSPVLLMEFQSGPETPLKPIEIVGVQEAPINSYVTFKVDEGMDTIKSWTMEMRDKKGITEHFGPYTDLNISIPGKNILGKRPEAEFKVTMTALTQSGKTIKKDTTVNMVLWSPGQSEEDMRFSVIYEFNDSKSIEIYQKYLTNIVAPKIPKNGTVIVHGHTDAIGDVAHNKTLSIARANDVKNILEKALNGSNRSDVTFEVYGFGKDQNMAPFENKFAEERFYNRTVIIDIVSPK